MIEEKVVKITIEVPYSKIEIGEIDYSVDKDDLGCEFRELEFDESEVKVNGLEFDIFEFDNDSLEEFAIHTAKDRAEPCNVTEWKSGRML